jgi:hypothetical protein
MRLTVAFIFLLVENVQCQVCQDANHQPSAEVHGELVDMDGLLEGVEQKTKH